MSGLPDPVTTAYRLCSTMARLSPEPIALGAGRVLGRAAALASRDRRAIVARNLRRVVGPELEGAELRRAVNATFDAYARYYVESFRLPSTPLPEVAARFFGDGWPAVEANLRPDRGVLLAIPHLGGWEWAAFWVARIKKTRVTAVVEPIEPPELFEWFVGLRRSLGMTVVPLGPDAGKEVLAAVKRGDVVCLLCDRDIQGNGIEVDFFGERTTLPAGPATLALRTGAPLLPTAVYFEGHNLRGACLPPLDTSRRDGFRADVARVTQDVAWALETLIRRAPEQWHLMQPNWPSDRELFE